MITVIGRRLIQLPLVILAISVITFGLSFISGDPSQQFIGDDWTTEEIAAFKRKMGFDRPWYFQYADFLGRAVQGDLGESWRHNEPSLKLVAERMPTTLKLASLSLLLSLVIAVPVGVIAATRRNTVSDAAAMFGALIAQSAPTFWVGIMLIMVLAVYLGWLPVSGVGTWRHFVMPVLALGTHFAGRTARLVRSSLLEVLFTDYVRTARAKGLAERIVVYKHALRNALIPVVAVVGLDLANMMAGSVVIESIFALNGVGRLSLQALSTKDLPVLQAAVILFALVFVVVNLFVDLLYRLLDPRIRLS